MSLNPALRWALLATALATVFVALQHDETDAVIQPAATSRRAAMTVNAGTGTGTGAGTGPNANAAAVPGVAGNPAGASRPDLVDAARRGWPAAPASARAAEWPALVATALAAWQPAPPPPPSPEAVSAPVPPTPPSPPPAPAFPYTLIGRVEDGDDVQVLLSGPLRTVSARLNDLVDGQWRLESIQPGGVVFVWVSGGQRTTVNYRSS